MENFLDFVKSIYRRKFVMAVVLVVSALGVLMFSMQDAHAIRISMKRVIFEGPSRSDIITIINNTTKEQTYRLGWARYRMTENKSLRSIEEGEEADDIKWADDMIRFAPRRVTVPPGTSQQIRLLLRRPRELEAGEYRAHLWIVTEVRPDAFDPEPGEEGKGGVKIAMQPAISMPVFVRYGDLTSAADITNVRLVKAASADEEHKLEYTIHRKGNRSLYGDLTFTCIAGGADFVAGTLRGVAVYTEIEKRNMSHRFIYPPEQEAACKKVRVDYRSDKDDRYYKGEIMASGVTK